MPNWCKNNLKIKANGEKVLDLLELLKDENGEFTMNKAVPMPKELEDTVSPTREHNQTLIDLYGAENWYDWRCKNWGVKWDASRSGFWQDGKDWVISFETPWGAPIEFMKKLSKMYPNMTFMLQFADESEGGYPLGEMTFKNGIASDPEGPDEGTKRARTYAESIWDEEWAYWDE